MSWNYKVMQLLDNFVAFYRRFAVSCVLVARLLLCDCCGSYSYKELSVVLFALKFEEVRITEPDA